MSLIIRIFLLLVVIPFGSPCEWKLVDIPRVHVSELSKDNFFKEYSQVPLVITGISDGLEDQWTFENLKEHCGGIIGVWEKTKAGSGNWGQIRDLGVKDMKDFIQEIMIDTDEKELYGFDYQVKTMCPWMLSKFTMPDIFTDCMVQHFQIYNWPTVMIGPTNTRSELHFDIDGLPFWMLLGRGKKHFRVMPVARNMHLTRPVDLNTFDFGNEELLPPSGKDFTFTHRLFDYYMEQHSFKFEVFNPDFEQFPDLCKAEVHEVVLQAGEVIYIPNAAPHGARNLERTIAVTANFFSPYDEWQVKMLDHCTYGHERCQQMREYVKRAQGARKKPVGPQGHVEL